MNTIFAAATPPGKSGVAVLRISGRDALLALREFRVARPPARMATLATLRVDARILDKALVLYFAAPNSFTGEDVVELHTHGGRAVIASVLEVLSTLPGYRLAEPGEFTRRAFLNGKMDLTAAEGLADLIDADTEAQARQAMRIMQGAGAAFYGQLRTGILHALAYLEAYIDFPDEEIPEHVLADIDTELTAVTTAITAQLAGKGAAEKLREGIRVAILGAPNVGKSSLLNALAGRDVAIVSNTAGTTRDVIEVELDIGGYAVILSDTAGLRESVGEIEQEGIRRSLLQAQSADIKIVVCAAGSAPEAEALALIDPETIVLLSKSDLGVPSPLPAIGGQMPIPVSVKSQSGLDALLFALSARIVALGSPEASFITRARHRTHLVQALVHLQNYTANQAKGLELRCEELRRASVEVGKITGAISVDELLGHIFSSFCIGK